MPADKWEFIVQNASEIKVHFHNLWKERVKARGFLSKAQAFLCFSPFVCLLLHRELITPNGHRADALKIFH